MIALILKLFNLFNRNKMSDENRKAVLGIVRSNFLKDVIMPNIYNL
jgi:hypothetical protein